MRMHASTKTKVSIVATTLAACAVAVWGGASAGPLPKAAKCPVFPRSNHFNQRVDRLPIASNSGTLIRSIGLDKPVHPDFGAGTWDGGPIGIPFVVVGKGQPTVPVSFEYADESDRQRYPIPRNAPVEGGRDSDGDRHVLIVDKHSCKLFELYDAHPQHGGARWTAGSGAIWNLRSNTLRPAGWTSADGAGLPILPGLARYRDVARGTIDHALRFTAPRTRHAYVYPARHHASDDTSSSLPPMGLRVRLKASADLSELGPQARIIAKALQRYGALLADNGAPWFFTGAPDKGWDDEDLHTLGRLTGADFEVVDTAGLPKPG
jgi:hypothetical protein